MVYIWTKKNRREPDLGWRMTRAGLYAAALAAGFFLFSSSVYAAADADIDSDGLSDTDERIYYTDVFHPDTDGDGYLDGIEVIQGFSPLAASGTQMHQHDHDTDGLNDWLERWFKSDIGVVDTDADGFSDFDEVVEGFDPASATNTEQKFDRKIVVDRTQQRLYYYVDTVKILNLAVSTGNPQTPTPAGTFQIQRLLPVARYVGEDYDLPNVKWNMQFKPRYFLHGAYWHNDFGKRTHSHGCVNLSEADAELLYRYVDVGMTVEIIGETPKRFWVGT